MKTKKKLPGYLFSMFRGHNSHQTDDIEGAQPSSKMLSYAEKAKMKMQGNKSPWKSQGRENPVFRVTPMANFLMDVHRALGRPPVHSLKRRRDLTSGPVSSSLSPI